MKNYKLPAKSYKLSRGFTLIELLVVIAIIAVIATTFVPNFMGARLRARDAGRKSDLSQMQKALELYKLDQTPQAYPTTGAFDASMCNQCWSSGSDCGGTVYMRRVPCDPGATGATSYTYELSSTSDFEYRLVACLENTVDTERDATADPACATTGVSYTIHEP